MIDKDAKRYADDNCAGDNYLQVYEAFKAGYLKAGERRQEHLISFFSGMIVGIIFLAIIFYLIDPVYFNKAL